MICQYVNYTSQHPHIFDDTAPFTHSHMSELYETLPSPDTSSEPRPPSPKKLHQAAALHIST